MTTIPDPFASKPGDREALAALADDGNPLQPHTPAAPPLWPARAKAALAKATAVLEAHPFLGLGVALGVGFVVGRALAARSS